MECPLTERKCVPCQGGTPPLSGPDLDEFVNEIDSDWTVVGEHHLEREFRFRNFRDALAFTNRVGELAESEGHHPEIYLAWGLVGITLYTHKIDGLSESDFILAAKIDQLAVPAVS